MAKIRAHNPVLRARVYRAETDSWEDLGVISGQFGPLGARLMAAIKTWRMFRWLRL